MFNIYLQKFDVKFFRCTPVPVGISMFFSEKHKKTDTIPYKTGMCAYLFLQWRFLGTGTPTYFYGSYH